MVAAAGVTIFLICHHVPSWYGFLTEYLSKSRPYVLVSLRRWCGILWLGRSLSPVDLRLYRLMFLLVFLKGVSATVWFPCMGYPV